MTWDDTATAYAHIFLSENGVPNVGGTRLKVKHVVVEYVSLGWSIAEICAAHPPHSLAEIHSALAFYYDHQSVMDDEIAEDIAISEQGEATWRASQEPDPLRAKLQASRHPV